MKDPRQHHRARKVEACFLSSLCLLGSSGRPLSRLLSSQQHEPVKDLTRDDAISSPSAPTYELDQYSSISPSSDYRYACSILTTVVARIRPR